MQLSGKYMKTGKRIITDLTSHAVLAGLILTLILCTVLFALNLIIGVSIRKVRSLLSIWKRSLKGLMQRFLKIRGGK